MNEVVELFAAAVVMVAAAAFSHFGLEVERPEPPRPAEARSVRRTPAPISAPRPRAECQDGLRLLA
jgi:hypothetical protein